MEDGKQREVGSTPLASEVVDQRRPRKGAADAHDTVSAFAHAVQSGDLAAGQRLVHGQALAIERQGGRAVAGDDVLHLLGPVADLIVEDVQNMPGL